ncbi:hypothetical protein AAAC51_34200 [Priestia megaterium]
MQLVERLMVLKITSLKVYLNYIDPGICLVDGVGIIQMVELLHIEGDFNGIMEELEDVSDAFALSDED